MSSVIDVLGEGFAIAINRPLLIVPLIVLELALLFAPQLTVGNSARDVAAEVSERGARWAVVGDGIARLEGYNVLDLVVLGLPRIRVAAFAPVAGKSSNVPGWHDRRVVAAGALAAPAALFSAIAGIVFVAYFRLMLASGLRSEGATTSPRSLVELAARLTVAALTAVGLLIIVGLPVVLGTILLTMFDLPGAAFLWLVLLVPVAWGIVHFYFVVHALVVDRLPVLPAFRASYQVVRRDPWQAARFIGVSLLLSTGLTYPLESIARKPEWAVLAVVLNAFLATGMILAAMLFYRDRARHLGLSPRQEGA
ncbi:MAG: hypothetical protein V9F06_06915 [Thermomicrobiales bacterium]